jgi:hypothetical protein
MAGRWQNGEEEERVWKMKMKLKLEILGEESEEM